MIKKEKKDSSSVAAWMEGSSEGSPGRPWSSLGGWCSLTDGGSDTERLSNLFALTHTSNLLSPQRRREGHTSN